MKKICLISLFFLLFLSGCASLCEVHVPNNSMETPVAEKKENEMTETVLFQNRISTTGAIEAEAAAYQTTDLGVGAFDCGAAIYADFNGATDFVYGYSWDNGTLGVYDSAGNCQNTEFIYVALFNNRPYATNWRMWLLVDGLIHSFSVDGTHEDLTSFDICIPSYSYCLVPISVVVDTLVQQSEHFIALMYANDVDNPNAYPITVACRNSLELHDQQTKNLINLEYAEPERVENEPLGAVTYISRDLEGREQLLVQDSFVASEDAQCIYVQIEPDQTVSCYISYVFLDNQPIARIVWKPNGKKQMTYPVELQMPCDTKEHQLYVLHVAADPSITNFDARVFPIQSSVYRVLMKAS